MSRGGRYKPDLWCGGSESNSSVPRAVHGRHGFDSGSCTWQKYVVPGLAGVNLSPREATVKGAEVGRPGWVVMCAPMRLGIGAAG